MNASSHVIRPTSPRVYLVLLHVMFLVLYGAHLLSPMTRVQAGLSLALATFTLLLVTLPRAQLDTAWFIGLLTVGNTGVLLATVVNGTSPELWIVGAVVLLLAMASYAPSILHFGLLSSLVIAGYGAMLHQSSLLHTDEMLVLPALLCLALVFVGKITATQAEIQRVVDTEDHTRNRISGDALTGLPTRAQFLERMARVVQYGQYNPTFRYAILFVDLDGFKPINDRLGHKAGDAVLRHTAKLFHSCLGHGDMVGRYGGDEFTFLLNQVNDHSDAISIAERILAKLQSPIDVGEPVQVGASIGIAFSTTMHETAEELIRDADRAMYRAKAQGKNRYVISDEADVPKTELRARWKRMAQLTWYS
jgi:diguanylate cyclase (GGDEF)-like protein